MATTESKRWVVEVGTPLVGAIDLATALARVPPRSLTKGMFYGRIADKTRDRWAELEKQLEAPPKNGRYLPFTDYPTGDHVRLVLSAAERAFPDVGSREALRRLGAFAFEDFRASNVGRVMMQLLEEPLGALERFPDAFTMTVKGVPRPKVKQLAEMHVMVEFGDSLAMPEYVAGLFEAIILHYRARPRIEVDLSLDEAPRYDVHWSP